MQSSHKILIGIGTALLAVNIWSMFNSGSNIEAIRNNIMISQKNIDTALINLERTSSQLENIDNKMLQFTAHLTGIQQGVVDINDTKDEAEHKSELILKELRKRAALAKEEFNKSDSLPPVIQIKPL